MIIKPMIRGSICINAHPKGCAQEVRRQITWVQNKTRQRIQAGGLSDKKPRAVLVVGCSTGFGLANRIVASFAYGASTIGVSLEKKGTATKGGTPGWYNNIAFDAEVKKIGIHSITINGDAFSDEIRFKVIEEAKKLGIQFDLVVYSLASPVRTDPDTGVLYKSVLKPIGKSYSGITVDPITEKMAKMDADPATEEEIAQTIKVMGGEDWSRWIDYLEKANVLAQTVKTVAFSYIGPSLSHAIYRDGTIGCAKKHLEQTAIELNARLQASLKGNAWVSINKGLVTRSSAVIPIIPLYLSVLFKVMKEKGSHERCIEQMERLFAERLYVNTDVPVDAENLIRIDDWELDPEVQKEVSNRMEKITEENLSQYADLQGYRHDFLVANGFDVKGVDYEEDIKRLDTI